MPFIIHGATGAQGGPLYASLRRAGLDAVAAVRDVAKFPDDTAVSIDNDSVDSLISAYRGADGVFIHLPQTSEAGRLQHARNIVQAIETAKPKRIIISTNGAIVDQPGSALQSSDDSAIMVLIRGVQDSGVSHAVVAPRLYLENLLLPMVFGPAQSEGVLRYPVAADYAVSWSSHLDVAEAAHRLLVDPSISGVVGIGHQPGLVGADLAEGFSQQFGRDIRYEALLPEAFGDLIEPMIGPATASVVGLYKALAYAPDNVIRQETSAQEVLGLHPMSVQQWLKAMQA